MSELKVGDEFAGHRIEGVAGRGGMGVVYRARDADLDRVVALKLIAPALAQDASFRERFIRETRVAASIDHPNVIPVFYAGEADLRLYIAMRHVDGDDLRTLVRREGGLDPARAARIVAQVGGALDAAHARGIVHRDVKPANVLLGVGDHAYLTDFGLTKRIASVSGQTRAGGWVGTLGYVAPEQIRGERVDARADVYALGCLLFYALTGEAPYGRDSDEATLWAHLNEPPPHVGDGAPTSLDEVLDRALAKDPEQRFQSAGDLGRAALAAAGQAVASEPERLVAVGPAAPAGSAHATVAVPDDVTAPTTAPRYGDETVASPAEAPAVPIARPRQDHRSRKVPFALVAGAAVLLGGTAFAVLGLGGGDDDPPATATTAARTQTTKPEPAEAGRRVAVVAAGTRPNALVATKDRVFVVSGTSQRLTLISTATNRPVRRAPKVGVGAASITAGFGSVWVVKGTTQSLLRYGLRDGARQGPAISLPAGQAVVAAAGEGAVWVGSRSGATRGVPQSVAKIAPGATVAQPQVVPNGVQNLAVGAGAVWVVNRARRSLTRIDVRTGAQRTVRGVGRDPYGVAVGAGSVWVTNSGSGTVSQLSVRAPFRKRRDIAVGREPKGIDVGAGAVWVANQLDGTLTRLRADNGDQVGEPVEVGSNPFAVSVRGRSAWATLLGENAVARVDFR